MSILYKQPIVVLVCIVIMLVVFQAQHASLFWVYTAEVCIDSAIGVTLLLGTGILILQTYVSPMLIYNEHYGIEGLELTLAIFQVIPIIVLSCFMKETAGLTFD